MIDVRDESAAAPSGAWEAPVLAKPHMPPPHPIIHAYTTRASAVFSRRDVRLPGYEAAAEAARALGFTPSVRTVGGHLAPVHEGTLIIDVIAAAEAPQARTRERFGRASTAIRTALGRLGVPAQVGELRGEYCPGEFSVNAAGATKLAGIAQRVTAWGFLLSINLVVDDPAPLRAVVAACYGELGLPVDPSRVGAVTDHLPGLGLPDAAQALIPELAAGLFQDDSARY